MARYEPDIPAQEDMTTVELVQYVLQELRKVSNAFRLTDQGYLNTLYVAPTKPRPGQVVMADGTKWNPGSGEGVYVYRGAAWHFLG